eukprot:CAMPEP_0172766844 /NCGR_PEP_ID=MMETSP1074-20121228/181943_1 /TAXON_ID=2916 /ORGANISM="Ceratium fusus, Strain PA161109" /LENGTH=118 /DNA_ID=CAMNT_0013602025 /DNA_START=29 /DNA_END=382 /DNA_ORIENTATION=+
MAACMSLDSVLEERVRHLVAHEFSLLHAQMGNSSSPLPLQPDQTPVHKKDTASHEQQLEFQRQEIDKLKQELANMKETMKVFERKVEQRQAAVPPPAASRVRLGSEASPSGLNQELSG